MVPSKSYERIGRLMVVNLGRNSRHYAGRVAGADVFVRGERLRVDGCSS
jgi:hypothetical protein